MRGKTFISSWLGLLCLLVTVNLSAQTSTITYDLSKYRLPDLKRQTFEMGFNLDGSGEHRSSLGENPSTGYSSASRLSDYTFGTFISPRYTIYRNTRKLQMYQSLSLGLHLLDYGRSRDINEYNSLNATPYDEQFQREMSNSANTYYQGTLREFIHGELFLEQGLGLGWTYFKHNRYSETLDSMGEVQNDILNSESQHMIQPDIELLVGWGRIERVEDARLAVYILDDLAKAGILAREAEQQDVQALAEIISKLQNERFFDARQKKIWELQQLDSAIQALGLVEGSEIVYYTLIQDNWDYAASPVRESGFQIAGGLTTNPYLLKRNSLREANYFTLDSVDIYESTNTNWNFELGGIIRLTYQKPINLYWQATIENTLQLYKGNYLTIYNQTAQGEVRDEEDQLVTVDNLYLSLGYYPNTRTSVHFYSSNSFLLRLEDKTMATRKELNVIASLGMSANYYFSPQLSFNFNASLDNNLFKSSPSGSNSDNSYFSNRLTGVLNAGFTYKFL
ncbi:MAG: hypothetical protein JW801_00435 [Bacteroidales bacterium]|nr:hypothetical protein [Bacteroidales bacterium]